MGDLLLTKHFWVAANIETSEAGGVRGLGLLKLCQFLGVLELLGYVLVQVRDCLTIKVPSLITLLSLTMQT